MTGRNLGIALVIIALVVGVWWTTRDGASESAGEEVDVVADVTAPKLPAAKASSSGAAASSSAKPAQTMQISMDADPAGTLLLEGQVLDARGDAVAGATVYLGSRPRRTATSRQDGGFSFDKLVGRRYALSARAGDLVGGPRIFDLTADSDPVVLRLRAGASISVTVVQRDTGSPVSGAAISVAGMTEASATTDSEGRAVIRGLRSGWEQLLVKASGYATARLPLRVPDAAIEVVRRVELEAGVKISGVVVTADGQPVAGARVVPRSSARPFDPINVFADGVATDSKGRFALEGLAVGTYRFLALHERYAPGSSDAMSLSESVQPAVEIVLQAGGIVAGTVFDEGGQPAPGAQVNLTSAPAARGSWGGGVQRSVVADSKGRFEVTGLPRERLSVLAKTAAASSDIVDVDLSPEASREVRAVELRLTVTGTIAGVVVDQEGEPLADVQVQAQPDFWGGQSGPEVAIRGGGFATTDGGGGFTIRGLAEGEYLVRASRTAMRTTGALRKPAKARTGATDVRIVLSREGGVRGKLETSDGSAPSMAIVSIAWAGAVPAIKGAFELEGVPPGTYDVTVRGPFPRRVVKGVEIKPGKTTDLGTIKIDVGRAITGRVIDAKGRAVQGAQVALGTQLVGDGANLITSLDDATASQLGIRRAVTDGNGEYRIAGVGGDEIALAAEHAEHGRSLPVAVPRYAAKVGGDAQIELVLVPFGSLKGKVSIRGEAAPDISILLTTKITSRQILATRSGLDGSFNIERVPAGDYKLTAMLGGGVTVQMVAVQVQVVAGEATIADLNIAMGEIDLEVMVSGKDGAQVDAAQVFLFGNPSLSPKTGGEVNQVFLSSSEAGDGKMSFANAGAAAVFAKIEPGDYALCVIPITGDMNDPVFATRLQQHATDIAVYCNPIEVGASPAKQTRSVAVPAMNPLPE